LPGEKKEQFSPLCPLTESKLLALIIATASTQLVLQDVVATKIMC